MRINITGIIRGIKTATKLYKAYRDYKQLRKYGFSAISALELAAMQAGVSLLELFTHVKKKSGDFGDINLSELAESDPLANTIYSMKKTF